MIQQTSLLAYEQIIPELGKRQQQVYEAIKVIEPCTDLQLSQFLGLPINSVVPRRNELAKVNLVEAVGRAYNPKTKASAMLWRCIC